jgi:DNA polymerase III epsilon subunit-like protein
MGRRCVFVDVESTGLQHTHQVTEAAWYDVDADLGEVFVPPHDLAGADPVALQMSGYHDRIARAVVDDGTALRRMYEMLGGDGTATTLVAANPSFDTHMLAALFRRAGFTVDEPWHHRKVDVCGMAYALLPQHFPSGEVPGLKTVAGLLGVRLDDHHSAMADVLAGVECYRALERLRRQGSRPVAGAA